MSPKLDRQDLPGLRQDIPKYTPWISSTAAAEWTKFLQKDLPDLVSPPPENAQGWIMEEVFCSGSTSHDQAAVEAEGCGEVNAELASMFAAEKATCQV